MPLRPRRTRFSATATAIARKTSREHIIPSPCPAQTPVRHVKAVTLRGSLPIALLGLPLAALPRLQCAHTLSLVALFLTAAHGSVLAHQWIHRH
jgi:hypothetical protein